MSFRVRNGKDRIRVVPGKECPIDLGGGKIVAIVAVDTDTPDIVHATNMAGANLQFRTGTGFRKFDGDTVTVDKGDLVIEFRPLNALIFVSYQPDSPPVPSAAGELELQE